MDYALFTGVRLVLSLIGIAIGSLMETIINGGDSLSSSPPPPPDGIENVKWSSVIVEYRMCHRASSRQSYWTKYYYRIRKSWKSSAAEEALFRWLAMYPARPAAPRPVVHHRR